MGWGYFLFCVVWGGQAISSLFVGNFFQNWAVKQDGKAPTTLFTYCEYLADAYI